MRQASVILALVCGSPAIGAPVPPPTQQVIPLPAKADAPAAAPAREIVWCDAVVEMQTAPASGVTSFWLSNGIRVHHLRLATQPRHVVVTIAMSGGKLLEEPATRGLSEVAAGVLDDWDTAAPEASRAAGMGGRDLRIDASAAQDAIMLRLSGSAADLEAGLGVVRALLTRPAVNAQNVEAAKEQMIRELRQREADPRGRTADAINQAVFPPDDVRLRPPDERSIAAIGAEGVKAWLERHTKENGAPIEAALVGDLTLAEALRLADATLGALPKRARVGPDVLRDRRILKVPRGPVVQEARPAAGAVGGGRTRATLVLGCFGPDMTNLADQRAMRAGVRIAINRLKPALADAGLTAGPDGITGGVYVSAYTGFDMVLLTASVEDAQRERAIAMLGDGLTRLAADAPTAEELAKVIDELARSADATQRDPRYWSGALARSTALGIDPDEIASGAAYYRALRPDGLRDVLKKYWREDAKISLIIRPGAPDAPEVKK